MSIKENIQNLIDQNDICLFMKGTPEAPQCGFSMAVSKRGDTSENLIALLETRLDTVVYRAKLAPTVFAARQLINHGHIKVNKKRVNVSSYLLKDTDQIEVNEKSKKLNVIDGSIQSKEREIPEYIQLDGKSKSVKLVRVPKFSEVPYPVIMEPNLVIVEIYNSLHLGIFFTSSLFFFKSSLSLLYISIFPFFKKLSHARSHSIL